MVFLDTNKYGEIDLSQLEELLNEHDISTLVSLMYANNEIGTIHPVHDIARLCREHKALFHSDTVQAVAHYRLDVGKWPVHFISGSAHKFHGPKGSGFLYVNGDIQIKPLIDGGGQERQMRAGTENVAGIAGLTTALRLACEQMEDRTKHIKSVRQHFVESLIQQIPEVEFNGQEDGLHTVLSVSIPSDMASDMLLLQLDMKQICASSGSACSSGTNQGSHVIREIRPDDGYVTVRFSFSHLTTKDEIDYVMNQLVSLTTQTSPA